MTTRRDFLKRTGSAAAVAAVGGVLLPEFANALTAAPIYPRGVSSFEELPIKELLMAAIGAAKSAGAGFSDARIGRYRQNIVGTREKQIVQVGDTDSIGIGIRALVNGAWGFAASQNLTREGVAAAAKEAAAIAKANRLPGAARGPPRRPGSPGPRRSCSRRRKHIPTRRGRAPTRSIRSRSRWSRRRNC